MIAVSAFSESPINRTTDHITTQQSGGETSRAAEQQSSRAAEQESSSRMLRLFAQRASAAVILSCVTRARSSLGSSTTMSKQVSSPISAARSPRQVATRPNDRSGIESLSLSIALLNSGAMRKKEDVCIFRTRDFQKQANLT